MSQTPEVAEVTELPVEKTFVVNPKLAKFALFAGVAVFVTTLVLIKKKSSGEDSESDATTVEG